LIWFRGTIGYCSVSDIESIARIFSQGLFYDYKRLDEMIVVLAFMFYMNWTLTWIVIVAMPILVVITRVFQRKMQVAFEEVRAQIANMNSFVQERYRNENRSTVH
jgi:ABC-type bacteriocin/lantibiotic exporter with double-glycine peptidase domain